MKRVVYRIAVGVLAVLVALHAYGILGNVRVWMIKGESVGIASFLMLFLPFAFLAAACVAFWSGRRWGVVAAVIALLLVLAPEARWLIRHPHPANAFLRLAGIHSLAVIVGVVGILIPKKKEEAGRQPAEQSHAEATSKTAPFQGTVSEASDA